MAETMDYRKVTDALAGALDRLHAARKVVETCQTALAEAQAKYSAASQAAAEVQGQLQAHLREVLPDPNRRP